jgi:hypothetical protein
VPWRSLLVQFVVAVCAVTLAPQPSFGQTAAASDVKAAFIYNFVKFTTWPTGAYESAQARVVCVMGDQAIVTALERTPRAGIAVTVRAVQPTESIDACRVLYVSGGIDQPALARIIEAVCHYPVLTVSDRSSFAALGGIAEIFNDSGRLRFAINIAAARRAGLTLSANMLSLARIVKDERHVLP